MQKLSSKNLNFLALVWAWYKHEIQKLGQRVEGEERVPLLWFTWQLVPSSLHLSLLHSQRLGTTIPQKWHRHGAERGEATKCPQFDQILRGSDHIEKSKGHMTSLWFPHTPGEGISQSQNIYSIFERNQPLMANLCMVMIFIKYCWNIKMPAKASVPWWGGVWCYDIWPELSRTTTR